MTRQRKIADPAARLRSSRYTTESRLSDYPAEWLESAIDTEHPDTQPDPVEFIATRGDDFGVSRAVFVQDLHRLARQASYRAYAANADHGYVVRTTTRGLPADEVAFAFFRVPLSEASLPKTQTGAIAGERKRLATIAAQAANGLPAEILAAWEHHRTYGWFCAAHEPDEAPHVIGFGASDCICAGQQAVVHPEEPTPVFIAEYRETHPEEV